MRSCPCAWSRRSPAALNGGPSRVQQAQQGAAGPAGCSRLASSCKWDSSHPQRMEGCLRCVCQQAQQRPAGRAVTVTLCWPSKSGTARQAGLGKAKRAHMSPACTPHSVWLRPQQQMYQAGVAAASWLLQQPPAISATAHGALAAPRGHMVKTIYRRGYRFPRARCSRPAGPRCSQQAWHTPLACNCTQSA